MHSYREKISAYVIYLIFSGANSLFFALVVTIDMVYQVEVVRLSPLQLVLAGTTLEVTAFICQVPTGVLADVYSRRLSVILGTFVAGIGFALPGVIPSFITVLIGEVLFGIGASFTDGAEQAWIADEVGVERIGHVFMRSTQIGLLGGVLGAVLSVAIASYRLNLPLIIGGGLTSLLAVFLLFFMPENGFQPAARRETRSWRQLGDTFKNGLHVVRGRPVLITILLIALFYGMYSEGFDRLSTAHFLADFVFPRLWQFDSVIWFGIFRVAGMLLTLAASEAIRRRVNLNKPRMVTWVLFVIDAIMVVGLLAFALAGNFFLAVVAYLGFVTFRSVNEPVYVTWLTQNTDAKVRATIISLRGQIDAIGQIAGGPPVGVIGSIFSLRAALVASSIILSPVLPLLAYASRKRREQSTTATTTDVEITAVEL